VCVLTRVNPTLLPRTWSFASAWYFEIAWSLGVYVRPAAEFPRNRRSGFLFVARASAGTVVPLHVRKSGRNSPQQLVNFDGAGPWNIGSQIAAPTLLGFAL
jgi:hypothetical protein